MLGFPIQKTAGGNDVCTGGGIGQVKIKGLMAQVEIRSVSHQNIVLEPSIPAEPLGHWKSTSFGEGSVS